MKTKGMSRRGLWDGGRWRAQASLRDDVQLMILEYVDVWLPCGRFLGRVHRPTPCSDMRSIDRVARRLVGMAAPAA